MFGVKKISSQTLISGSSNLSQMSSSEPITLLSPKHHQPHHHHHHNLITRDAAIQSLNTTIQLHFDKTLEKKRSIDLQKKHLHLLFLLFFLLLSLLLSPSSGRLQCRHCWLPISLLSLAFSIFYVSVAQTLRCINEFKYQRRCHKLTLSLATERIRGLRGADAAAMAAVPAEYEVVEYQEPPEGYLGKFKRTWGLYFGFLIVTFGVTVAGSVVVLCF